MGGSGPGATAGVGGGPVGAQTSRRARPHAGGASESFEGETLLRADEPARQRVAVRCGFAGAGDFMQALKETRPALRAV